MSWFKKWRSQHVDYREASRSFRKDRRQWTRGQVGSEMRRTNMLVSTFLSLGGLAVYWTWEKVVYRMAPDPVGLLLAAIAPPIVYIGFTWLRLRIRASAVVFYRYKQFYDAQNPPVLPWASAVVLDDRGATFRLLTTQAPLQATEVFCDINLGSHRSRTKSSRAPIQVSKTSPIEYRYPDEFDKAKWPLEPGDYHILWTVRSARSIIHTQALGDTLRIKERRWR